MALGSEAILTVSSGLEQAQNQLIFADLWKAIYDFDKKYSRFRWDSDITNLNQHSGQPVPIDTNFKKLLLASQKMAYDTDAIFNPFILPALTGAGYLASWAPNHATSNPPNYSDRAVVNPSQLILKNKTAQIPENSAIDIGGIGKGYLLDVLSENVERRGITNYWFSLGGDIIARGGDPSGQPWKIKVADAKQPNHTKAYVLASSDRAVAIATSGITKRRGQYNTKNWHHIIDSNTGEPAKTDILTCTVVMNSAVLADVYASCIVALGSKKYDNFAKQHRIKNIFIQTNDKVRIIGKEFIST